MKFIVKSGYRGITEFEMPDEIDFSVANDHFLIVTLSESESSKPQRKIIYSNPALAFLCLKNIEDKDLPKDQKILEKINKYKSQLSAFEQKDTLEGTAPYLLQQVSETGASGNERIDYAIIKKNQAPEVKANTNADIATQKWEFFCNYEKELDHWSNNRPSCGFFSNIPDHLYGLLYMYSKKYYDLCHDPIAIRHQNPNWDRFFDKTHTSTFSMCLNSLRRKMLPKLFEFVDALEDTNVKLWWLAEAKKMDLFKKHRNNSIFSFGRTNAVKDIDSKIASIKADKSHPGRSYKIHADYTDD